MQEDILKPFAEDLRQLVNDHILTIVDSGRQERLLLALRNELFWRAKQYLTYKFVDGNKGVTVVPISGPETRTGRSNQQRALTYTFNITRGDGQKFVAVVGARPPHVNVEPKDIHDPESVQMSKDGDSIVRYLSDRWDSKQRQKDLARTIFRSGPRYSHVCWVADAKKNGEETVYDSEVVEQAEPNKLECQICGFQAEAVAPDAAAIPCPRCGAAQTMVIPGETFKTTEMTNPRQVAKGMPELHDYTLFDVSHPPERKRIEECEWWVLETLDLSGKVKEIYGDAVSHVKDDGPANSQIGAQETVADARDLITSDSGEQSRRYHWWHTRVWLRPEMYHYAKPELRKVLRENFPDGVRLVFVNNNYVAVSVAESLVDVWAVCKTGTDDLILADPICHDLIPINEIINNFFNLAIETVLRAIPKTIAHPRLLDRKSVEDSGANVAEVIFAKAGLGEDLSNMLVKMPTASFSEQMIELAGLFRQYSREIDGVIEAVFGGGDPAPTWRQEQQRKNQALAQFYIAYDEMTLYWKDVYSKAMKLFQRYGSGEVTVPQDDVFAFGPRVVDLGSINPDIVRVEPEETMPETRAEEVDRLMEQFAMPPQVQTYLDVFHPINVPRITQLLGLRGMKSTYADLVQKTLNTIQELLASQPVPQIDPMGMPIEQPSIVPDPFEYKNAQFVVEIIRAFVNSSHGEEHKVTNPAGYANVRLFGTALDQIAAQQMMMAAPPEASQEQPQAA